MPRLFLRNFIVGDQACHFAEAQISTAGEIVVHDHDFYEVFWIEAGRGIHLINGKRVPLSGGMLVFMRHSDTHGLAAQPGKPGILRICNLAFHRSSWRQLCHRYGLGDLYAPGPADPVTMSVSPAVEMEIHAAAADLRAGRRDRLTLDRFLLTLVRLVELGADQPKSPSVPDWLKRAMATLTSDPSQFDGTTRGLAKLAARSPEHVARAFRKHFNKTPTDVINDAKVSIAARRLIEVDDSILDVALTCGYSNLSHFYKQFHARFGVTPRRYRLNHRSIVSMTAPR